MAEYKYTNRLSKEKSPYLLQHAHNPVHWYPWSDEAFEKAKAEDKPIFLSIGYSTCHWCHVMERESFEDSEVAEVLNRDFVCIKVDREERPDVDHIYMGVCQALTGSGGWPLTIMMTSDKKPFFAGTYFPKNNRMGMQGLISILEKVNSAWEHNRSDLLESSDRIVEAINKSNDKIIEGFNENLIDRTYNELRDDFDKVYGGFGGAPKFPSPHNLFFLLRYWYISREAPALEIVEKTLDSMYKGGIYDHIGYGFSRYSTDRKWLVPHFEKMLYDNALIAIAYLETYAATKNEKYAQVAKEIFAYILRDMTYEEGGFYCAEDADSEGIEGKFYIWSFDEVNNILGEQDGKRFAAYFDITPKGNFEGQNILNLIEASNGGEDREFIEECRENLFKHREKRIHPYKDDKILTSWNGLMITAMAMGGRILGNSEYTLAAEKAVEFIYRKLIRNDGRLLARFRDEEAGLLAYVDDYTFLIWGLIELYETTFNPSYLEKAIKLNDDLIKYFWDDEKGGLFVYGSDGEQLLTRPKEIYDGATPSGNAVSALNFLRLARLTGRHELEDRSMELLKSFGSDIQNYPRGYAFSIISLLYAKSSTKEIVIVKDDDDDDGDKADNNDITKDMIAIINEEFRPFTISLLYVAQNKTLKDIAPFVQDYKTMGGKPTTYVCENFACSPPVNDMESFRKLL